MQVKSKVIPGVNDMATVRPDLAIELVGDPTTVTSRTSTVLQWKCLRNSDHVWFASAHNRTRYAKKCPFCSGHRVCPGDNDLATTHPELAMQADGWDPTTVSRGSTKSLLWRGHCGHSWSATPNGRTASNAGCPTCAKPGYDPNKPGYIYLVRHDYWGLLQIGISNHPEQRIGNHASRGWALLDVIGPMDAGKARTLERDSLKFLRASGITLGSKDIAGTFSGYTESWIEEDFPVSSLNQLFSLCTPVKSLTFAEGRI